MGSTLAPGMADVRRPLCVMFSLFLPQELWDVHYPDDGNTEQGVPVSELRLPEAQGVRAIPAPPPSVLPRSCLPHIPRTDHNITPCRRRPRPSARDSSPTSSSQSLPRPLSPQRQKPLWTRNHPLRRQAQGRRWRWRRKKKKEERKGAAQVRRQPIRKRPTLHWLGA